MAVDILDKARDYMNKGHIEKAQIILRRALDENPSRARVLELCGDLASKTGRTDEAIARYEHASENYTHNNQYAEAIICLEKILKIGEPDETVLFRLVDLYRFFGLPNEGVKRILKFCTWALESKEEGMFISGLRKIVELQPKNLSLRLSYAKILLSINRSQEAHDELRRLKTSAQEVGDESILGEIQKLLPHYDGGEELDPKSRVELGNLLYEIGSKDEAIVEFNRAASDLIGENRADEALTVLNRIIEIDPNNVEALNRIKLLQGGSPPAAPAPVEKTPAEPEMPQPNLVRPPIEEVFPIETGTPPAEVAPAEMPQIQGDLDILQDLAKEVDGFNVTPEVTTPATPVTEPAPPRILGDMPQLEGQIADIEFLLKEAEAPPVPSFEVAQQFDDFRGTISWESEDLARKLDLAGAAFAAELYSTALDYLREEREKKELWPRSLEIIGASLVRLGQYSDALKAIGPTILLEEIPETEKIELRYILASVYEGLGDFENALREIEHIMATDPNYRDVREVYELLGGKMKFEEKPPTAPPVAPLPETTPAPSPIVPSVAPEPETEVPTPLPREEITVAAEPGEVGPVLDEAPLKRDKGTPPIPEDTFQDQSGENISFL